MEQIQRLCLVSRKKYNREDLYRIVRRPDGEVVIDTTYKLQGRGAYILKDKSIILQAYKKNSLSRALRCQINSSIYEELLKML